MPTINKKGATGSIAAALVIAVPFICHLEGRRLHAYSDVAGVITICDGETGYKLGDTMTDLQCDELTKEETKRRMEIIAPMLREDTSPETLTAYTSFAYNVGISRFERSNVLALEQAGDIPASCQAMMDYSCVTVGVGKGVKLLSPKKYGPQRHCANAAANKKELPGLVNRRRADRDECLKGIGT